MSTKSWINAGEKAHIVYAALADLQVPGASVNRRTGIVSVIVPDGTDPDLHQDALTRIANAVLADVS